MNFTELLKIAQQYGPMIAIDRVFPLKMRSMLRTFLFVLTMILLFVVLFEAIFGSALLQTNVFYQFITEQTFRIRAGFLIFLSLWIMLQILQAIHT